MRLDNPAQRLHEILERARATKSADQAAREVWRSILNTEGSAQLLDRLGKVMALPQAILVEIEERHPGSSVHHHHWVDEVAQAFNAHSLDSPWNNFRSSLSPRLLSNVAIAATALKDTNSRTGMDEDAIANVRSAIELLESSILEAELGPELKRYLIRQVARLREAINDYAITGGDPVMDIVDATLGHLATRAEGRQAVRTPEGARIAETLAVIADAVTVAGGLPPLLAATGVTLVHWIKQGGG